MAGTLTAIMRRIAEVEAMPVAADAAPLASRAVEAFRATMRGLGQALDAALPLPRLMATPAGGLAAVWVVAADRIHIACEPDRRVHLEMHTPTGSSQWAGQSVLELVTVLLPVFTELSHVCRLQQRYEPVVRALLEAADLQGVRAAGIEAVPYSREAAWVAAQLRGRGDAVRDCLKIVLLCFEDYPEPQQIVPSLRTAYWALAERLHRDVVLPFQLELESASAH